MPNHTAPWSLPAAECDRPSLVGRASADVCVIGGGIAGLTTAYLLARSGVSVILIEAKSMAAGETRRTSAHLASALDDGFQKLERIHGEEGARLATESHASAIDFIEELARNEEIACDFQRVPGYLFAADAAGEQTLDAELAAARRAGLSVESVTHPATHWLTTGRCLRYDHQAQCEPLGYVAGLLRAAEALGVRVYGHTRAETINGGAHATVITDAGATISCGAIAVCTNVPINDRIALQTSLEAYRSYVITVALPRGHSEPGLYWDTADPYHYVRTITGAEEDLIVVGGEDHKTGQGPEDAEQPFRQLDSWIRERVADCGTVMHRWSGQIIEPVDGLGMIGRNTFDADNVFVITGDSGNGLTHGTLGAMIVSDQIRGIANPWEKLYRPSRMRLGSTGEFTRHNVNVLGQYSDWLRPAESSEIETVAPGCAALVRDGMGKWAVYHEAAGRLHVCSAVCPHLGGLVRWNAAEQTWDCPCHGSRFAVDGTVLNGPANSGLKPIRRDGEEPGMEPALVI